MPTTIVICSSSLPVSRTYARARDCPAPVRTWRTVEATLSADS
jgi:hypothetical protein